MKEPIFCYRISAEAGIAHDGEGNDRPAYTQVSAGNGVDLEEKDYNNFHENIKYMVAGQMGIAPEHFEPISREEYALRVEEDE
ncbi:hypothetical protein [Salimicrobium halophilum]|uniref:Uncharacterized protein n=1 Tax=Salimicrobium halophilum TaxID=86666 RepID=A0A1G8WF71_9BACI|nr:hypothetical protein [Salimicrobium halophilum]SDJ76806.1 hypothetical protein SAMN04490247_3163 [Salimicrobium halophilum]